MQLTAQCTKEYYTSLYKEKLCTAKDIAMQIMDNDVCVSSDAYGEPQAIVDAITARAIKGEVKGVSHHLLLASRPWQYLEMENSENFKHVSWFTSPYSRKATASGLADFLPNNYSQSPRMWREFLEADVAYMMVSPMDKHGYFSFGVAASQNRAAIEKADRIFLEVNPHMPRTLGDCFVHISEVTALCESSLALPTLPEISLCDKDYKIGEFIVDRIPNGACIQLGIGGMPNAVGKLLKDKRNLGIHTEMFVDSMIDLIEAGAVSNRCKGIDRLTSVTAFTMGSQRLYDFIDDNPSVKFCSVEYTNDPYNISKNDSMNSINACIEVDLLGQVCSESVGTRNISGTGGQLDFVRGACMSKNGHSYICTYSTAKNDTLSSINLTLNKGAHVSTPKNDVDCIVTEYGVAELRGKTALQRAKALIAIAHPKFRDELIFEAKKINLLI